MSAPLRNPAVTINDVLKMDIIKDILGISSEDETGRNADRQRVKHVK